jgi:hypothetical protein
VGITAAVTAGAAIGSAVIGNQKKQKAKGEAAQVERDSQAAQDAADAKAKQSHDANIQAQAQAGAVARKALGGTLDDGPAAAASAPPTLLTPTAKPPAQDPGYIHTLASPGRKALLGS